MWESVAAGGIVAVPFMTISVVIGLTTDDALLTYGPLGVMSVMLALFARETVARLVKDRDRANEQRDQMVNDVINRMMPVIQRTVEMLEKRQQIDVEVLDTLKDVRRALEKRP